AAAVTAAATAAGAASRVAAATAATAAATASAAARDAAIRRRNGAWVASLATRHPPRNTQPAHPRRFFFALVDISRCEKFFCVVKNHAAWHNTRHCRMEKSISYLEISMTSN
ncbi:hypothetical protein, partial [Burkholderia ubonensis]|uniref:hypothetical protein n=1 Tax=Burkholderia ubonensis TaxID=101571 RepID=UPI0015A730CA